MLERPHLKFGPAVLAVVGATALGAGSLAAQDSSLERLNSSERHHEWVAIEQDDRAVHTFVVFPESSEPTAAVIVIHENRGLTDWVRGVADRVAEAGYIALAPDLLSGMGPGGGKTSDYADSNAARDGIYELSQEQVTADLHAVADYAKALPAASGELMVMGFCWGGSQTFHFATQREDLAVAMPFYGTAPTDKKLLSQISCPVYGFYGGNDERVGATIEPTAEEMQALGKIYEPVTYDGASHGFMRRGEGPDATEEDQQALRRSWTRWMEIVSGH